MRLVKVYYHSKEEKIPLSWLNLHPDLLKIMEEMGIIELAGDSIKADGLQKIYKMMRLKNLLGVNFNGAAIIVDLLERIEELEDEIEELKRKR
ncbi:chaperone modulator CbpM [Syntrophomonas wolfei]|jgi:MerR family transcriptional regulator/heat shock protein HspR|uniref:chaperone modulator CbpM n=1 Tax=Syntrophomonas wolfei TaxID=863 RepID=UPI000774B68C|nr:chaperone modulator CbpM [Syntrophomonas wolfei]